MQHKKKKLHPNLDLIGHQVLLTFLIVGDKLALFIHAISLFCSSVVRGLASSGLQVVRK